MSKQSIVIIIVVFFFCVISVSLTGLWTCTNGTLKSEDWKWANCLKIPGGDEDDDDDGDDDDDDDEGSDLSEQIANDDEILEKADNYGDCWTGLAVNQSKTSFNANDNSAGVRWYWLEADRFSGCAESVTKYRVKVSSSLDNHLRQYYYDVPGGTANSFAFKNAPTDWLSGQNVKFKITALTLDDLVISNTITVELDANESTNDGELVGVGIPVDFNDMTEVPVGGDPPPPIPDPINCSGGTWSNLGGCMLDGVEVDIDDCGEPCTQRQVLGGDDFIPASNGGTCVTERTIQIPRSSCEDFVISDPTDCSLSEWRDVILEGGSACTKLCGGGTKEQIRDVLVQPINGGIECGALSRTVDCNTQDCPVDCVGSWSCGAWASAGSFGSGGHYGERDCTYVVTRPANAYGDPCPHKGGDTKTENRIFLCDSYKCGPRGSSTCYNCDNLPWK